MTVNIKMPQQLRKYFQVELHAYHAALRIRNYPVAWKHLERAHILGQQYPYQHSMIHWKMLLYGFKIKSTKEVLGQLPRLLFGGIKSFVGIVPIGNTGGANVPALKPLPIPDDLNKILIRRY